MWPALIVVADIAEVADEKLIIKFAWHICSWCLSDSIIAKHISSCECKSCIDDKCMTRPCIQNSKRLATYSLTIA
jgi:hypothetical protein